jgi:hypothetical protein
VTDKIKDVGFFFFFKIKNFASHKSNDYLLAYLPITSNLPQHQLEQADQPEA